MNFGDLPASAATSSEYVFVLEIVVSWRTTASQIEITSHTLMKKKKKDFFKNAEFYRIGFVFFSSFSL